MDADTQYRFDNLAGGKLEEAAGHVPSIEIRGSTVTVRCSCGVNLSRATDCNRPGISYAIYTGKLAYRKHTGTTEAPCPPK